jgi:hypothetical protein
MLCVYAYVFRPPPVCPQGTFLNSTEGSSSSGTCADCPVNRWCPGGDPKARRPTDNIGGAARGCNPPGGAGLVTKSRRSTRVNDCGACASVELTRSAPFEGTAQQQILAVYMARITCDASSGDTHHNSYVAVYSSCRVAAALHTLHASACSIAQSGPARTSPSCSISTTSRCCLVLYVYCMLCSCSCCSWLCATCIVGCSSSGVPCVNI